MMDRLSKESPPTTGSRAAALVRAATKPVAESPQIEPPRPASGEKPLERAGAETVAGAAINLLPTVQEDVKNVRIGWYLNRSLDGFRAAIDANKPFVLVVASDTCDYCTNLVFDVLRCPAVNRWAGEAVFGYSTVSGEDKGAIAIAGSLKMSGYPSVAVLEPETRILLERGRINGYFEAGPLGGHLSTILSRTRPRVLPDDFDPNEMETSREPAKGIEQPAEYFGSLPPSILTAAATWDKLGLRHRAPEPKCQ